MAEALTGPWAASPQTRPLLRVVVVHALAFDTWRSLVRAGLPDSDAAGLLVALAEAVAERLASSRTRCGAWANANLRVIIRW